MGTAARIFLAILVAALLVMGPYGVCAAKSAPRPCACPCCPKAPAPPAARCMCADAPVAPVAVQRNADQGVWVEAPADAPAARLDAVPERPVYVSILFAPHDRYLSYHQLLV